MVAPSKHVLAAVRAYGVDRTTQRLMKNLTLNDAGCWERPAHGNGYNTLKLGGTTCYLAHRVAWAIANNANPGPGLVCHTCDNRRCVNPDHLFLGTPLDNVRDMDAKGRCKRSKPPLQRKSSLFHSGTHTPEA